jgi:hypothetical protein
MAENRRRKIMNKTQKGAWYALVCFTILLGLVAWWAAQLFVTKERLYGGSRYIAMLGYIAALASGWWLRKKQSKHEPDADERDKMIKKKALSAAAISLGLIVASLLLYMYIAFGPDYLIPVWALAILSFGIGYLVLAIYSVAVLVQYGRGDEDGEK